MTIVEQGVAGAQGAPYTVKRIAGAAAVPTGGLLDALTAEVELGAGKGDHVDGSMRGGRRHDLGGGGLVADVGYADR